MSAYRRLSIPDLLNESLTLYTNVSDPEIAARLADPYGYAETDVADGLALRAAAARAAEATGAEAADGQLATARVNRAQKALRTTLVDHRDAARKVHRRGTEGYGALQLSGDVPLDRAGLIETARRFYGTAAARPDLVAAVRGLTPAVVADAQAQIQTVETADATQDDEKGEARRASTD